MTGEIPLSRPDGLSTRHRVPSGPSGGLALTCGSFRTASERETFSSPVPAVFAIFSTFAKFARFGTMKIAPHRKPPARPHDGHSLLTRPPLIGKAPLPTHTERGRY